MGVGLTRGGFTPENRGGRRGGAAASFCASMPRKSTLRRCMAREGLLGLNSLPCSSTSSSAARRHRDSLPPTRPPVHRDLAQRSQQAGAASHGCARLHASRPCRRQQAPQQVQQRREVAQLGQHSHRIESAQLGCRGLVRRTASRCPVCCSRGAGRLAGAAGSPGLGNHLGIGGEQQAPARRLLIHLLLHVLPAGPCSSEEGNTPVRQPQAGGQRAASQPISRQRLPVSRLRSMQGGEANAAQRCRRSGACRPLSARLHPQPAR